MSPDRIETRNTNLGVDIQIQPQLSVPKDKRGRVRWSLLKKDPEHLCSVIRSIVGDFVSQGNTLTYRNLRKAQLSHLGNAISDYYPGGLSAVIQDLDMEPRNRSKGYWKDPSVIESAARRFISDGHTLTSKELRSSHNGYLESAIYAYYPGRLKRLRQNIGVAGRTRPAWVVESTLSDPGVVIKRDTQNRVKWRELTPEQIVKLIEQEAQFLIDQGVRLTQKGLHTSGREDLSGAIGKFYPGGFRSLKDNLNLPQERVPQGYWTPDRIRQAALEFSDRNGGLTASLLNQARRSGLMGAIRTYYPGGLVQLKVDLGFELSERPKNYWTPERIEQEAIDFAIREGGLSDYLLEKKGSKSLRAAIQVKYPGKMTQLKINLGIQGVNPSLIKTDQRPSGYWKSVQIKQEAEEFYNKEGNLNLKLLARCGRKDLSSAIRKMYPGGIQSLRHDLGLSVQDRRPKSFWTPENMLKETKAFYDIHGRIEGAFMNRHGQSGLSSAITSKYPGGWRQLRIDLGIASFRAEIQSISPEEANQQLRRLLEV